MTDERRSCQTSTEHALIQIWCSVFKVTAIAVTDNFLDLGGDSVIAARILLRVRESLHVEIPLRLLFEDPGDIRTVADLIDRAQ
jgi:acyl carrier protein